jgi:phosphoribosylcarboxyaminoimidazole (NCAIR) mutase
MPPGIPVATMAIGIPGAKNAAIMAAEILAIKDPSLREKLLSHKKEMADEVETKDSLLQRIGYAEYLEKKRKKEI